MDGFLFLLGPARVYNDKEVFTYFFFFSNCFVMRLSRRCARFDTTTTHCRQQCRQLALLRRSLAIRLFCVCAVTLEGLTLLLLEHHWTMTITTVMMTAVVEIKCWSGPSAPQLAVWNAPLNDSWVTLDTSESTRSATGASLNEEVTNGWGCNISSAARR